MDGEQIKKIRKALKLNQTEFANKLGVSKRTIISYEQGKVVPGTKEKILKQMYNEAFNNSVPEAYFNTNNGVKLVPLISIRAKAGFLSGWGDQEYIEELPKIPWEVDREYKGNYVSFEVEGDSMNNSNPSEAILDRDILLCREVQKHHWQNKIHINSWDFVIAHRDLGVVVKRIIDHNLKTAKLTLHSLNELYEDYTVSLDEVIALFNVVAVKRSRRR
jgi:transcriptional regulator with XRE-family HTH domain